MESAPQKQASIPVELTCNKLGWAPFLCLERIGLHSHRVSNYYYGVRILGLKIMFGAPAIDVRFAKQPGGNP